MNRTALRDGAAPTGRPGGTHIIPAGEGPGEMIEEVLCPHCDQPTVVDTPETATSVDELHHSLRYSNRESCQQCDREFSVRYE